MEGDFVMGAELSIIIPYFNVKTYLNKLLDCLAPQITKDVEVIVIDDGSEIPFKTDYEWCRVIRKENGGVSSARNLGIDASNGDYLSFIDADDLVSDKYVETILKTLKSGKYDYINLSWESINKEYQVKLGTENDKFPFWNRSVWNRVYKRSIIGDFRFNENKSFGEDSEFVREVIKDGMIKTFIQDTMYFYNTNVSDSLTKRFQEGRLKTRRVIYYFPIVTKNMTFLIDEMRELNKVAEITLMTNVNNLPQLEKYCFVMKPARIRGTELRGYPTNLFTKITMPLKADIVIWTEKTCEIGGIETFNFNFCKQLSKYYDIIVLYNIIDSKQKARLSEFARVIKNDIKTHIDCDTLIINRITDDAPKNVFFKQKVQMVHSCKWAKNLITPQNNDHLIAVSETVAKTYPDFKKDYKVIHNLTVEPSLNRALILVSATRTGTNEKGQKRMIALSNLMKKRGIPFIWYCFSDNPIQGANNICFLKPTLNISPYIKSADYLVQLSDHEGFCYSIVEAMELGTPILVTDLGVLPELGYKEGVTGYTIPWEIKDDFEVEKIYDRPLKGHFVYKFDNDKRIEQWREVLGKGHPLETTKEVEEPRIKLRAMLTFDDALTGERIGKGHILERNVTRAYDLIQKKFCEIVLEE